MCLAIPAKIIVINDSKNVNKVHDKSNDYKDLEEFEFNKYAKVEIMGVENKVNIQLIEEPRVGDYVLVHAGCAIQKIDTEYFNYLSDFYSVWLEEN